MYLNCRGRRSILRENAESQSHYSRDVVYCQSIYAALWNGIYTAQNMKLHDSVSSREQLVLGSGIMGITYAYRLKVDSDQRLLWPVKEWWASPYCPLAPLCPPVFRRIVWIRHYPGARLLAPWAPYNINLQTNSQIGPKTLKLLL